MKIGISSDKLGMCASMICLIHCVLIPFFLILGFDTLLHVFDQEWIEVGLIGSSLFIGLYSFLRGYFHHRKHFVPVLFLAGFLLLVNGEAVPQIWLALALSVTGALIIIYAHFQNLKLKQLHATTH